MESSHGSILPSAEVSDEMDQIHRRQRARLFLDPDRSNFDKLVELRSEYWRDHVPVPANLMKAMEAALANEEASIKANAEGYDADFKLEKTEGDLARSLSQQLRLDLGLPPKA